MTRKIIREILIFLSIICTMFSITTKVYATVTEEEELKGLLNDYKNDLGDLEELKVVVDKIYNDLYATDNVTTELKETLHKDVEELDNVSNMNPIILAVLKVEIDSQIDNLDNENLSEVRNEIKVIREWIGEQVDDDEFVLEETVQSTEKEPEKTIAQEETKQINTTQTVTKKDNIVASVGTILPNTGYTTITVALIIAVIISILFGVKYKKYRGI